MQVHLTRFDLEVLRQQAAESFKLDDGGESFAEEALARLGEEDVLAIEEMADGAADDFLIEVFLAWNGGENLGVIETLGSMLEDLDIELTYDVDEDDDDLEDTEAWDDDVEEEDDEDELKFD